MSCVALTKGGEPCGAAALTGSDYCLTHDPARAADRAEWRRRGGFASRGVQNGRGGRRVAGQTVAPPADWDAAGEPVALRDVPAVLAVLERVVGDALAQGNTAARNRTVGYLLSIALKGLEVGELEGRIEALEARLGEPRRAS